MMSKKSISFGFNRFGLLLVFLIQMVCLSAKKIQVHGLPHINQLPTHIINLAPRALSKMILKTN